jgi:hypothetical protein
MIQDNEQLLYMKKLTHKLNFVKEFACNLHLPVRKGGFRKFHPQLQNISALGFE